ncbi:MAG: type II toxin-antitoxin system Phd/YefM family antitoxin [Candidatus Binatus sp.]|uniref:type II toxin-antitoxin system Phd/YefM family antitoxin n=1 Tax=Candidatus Binatus sp. TaxID=2811406 RepID=UPI002723E9C5|nr:type II toxin-antitoxin system Phd/YefM family antitoxin [Candidatus Binatus sp.]MDO8434927.1 type II toxin-antitoxin system Phd/YefM family antitoxin [Candidatus Binatus sp.]
MKKAKIGELRNGLSRYLDHVRAGGRVLIYDRDTPIAEIVPLSKSKRKKDRDEERLARLERKGIITRGSGKGMLEWLKNRQIVHSTASLVDAILEERESGR